MPIPGAACNSPFVDDYIDAMESARGGLCHEILAAEKRALAHALAGCRTAQAVCLWHGTAAARLAMQGGNISEMDEAIQLLRGLE